jgi:predicted transcriptional regulator
MSKYYSSNIKAELKEYTFKGMSQRLNDQNRTVELEAAFYKKVEETEASDNIELVCLLRQPRASFANTNGGLTYLEYIETDALWKRAID